MAKTIKLTESQLIKFVNKIVEHLEYHDVDEMYEDRVEDVMSSLVLKHNPIDFSGPKDFAITLIDMCVETLMDKYFETFDDEDELREQVERKYTKALINYWYANSGNSDDDNDDW